MKGLLVRVAADQTAGNWNGYVDSKTGKFTYVPIPESKPVHDGLEKPYKALNQIFAKINFPTLPRHLLEQNMHLDPDFEHLTYGDQGERAKQIDSYLGFGDIIVFYAGLKDIHPKDIHPNPRLVYAIIGLYVVEKKFPVDAIPESEWNCNAHTRRKDRIEKDIVVRAKKGVSGRLEKCIPIGSYRKPLGQADKRECYRVEPKILKEWGKLSVQDGFLQRSARLPKFQIGDIDDASRFYKWFCDQNPMLIASNN